MNKPDFYDMGAWLHEHDLASKLEGWLITNDSDNICCISRLDDPLSMAGTAGWPADFTEPKFASDEEAIEFVRCRASAGSQWHAEAVAIHDARIPMSLWIPDSASKLHEQILDRCSVGPWRHGLHLPGFSADSQPCVYGNEREFPLAMLDEDDQEASANVVLMAAAWELCEQLSSLVDAALAAERTTSKASTQLRKQWDSSRSLLSRIGNDLRQSAAERYGKEQGDE